jgi:hypothetical protein
MNSDLSTSQNKKRTTLSLLEKPIKIVTSPSLTFSAEGNPCGILTDGTEPGETRPGYKFQYHYP